MLSIFETLQKKEILLDLPKSTVNLYTCGPTVYNTVHIGNLRSFVMADLLYRTLIANNYPVNWAMNITDIDDKTVNGTKVEYGSDTSLKTLKTYTQRYSEQFFGDLRAIGINTEHINFINATECITEIQNLILQLIKLNYAYQADDGSTYFSIDRYQKNIGDYGKLIGEGFLKGAKIGARIQHDDYDKENPSDFALWKAWEDTDSQIFWEHPILGKGRPGWHIECSAINNVAFAGQLTHIHTGGVDLIFPHHTNEIAQSQPLAPFVKYWIHFEHLLIDGKKMAKSLQNIFTLDHLNEKGFSPLDLRYLFLQSNFRQQTNFTWTALDAARTARTKLEAYLQTESQDATHPKIPTNKAFINALNNNLNSAEALAIAWSDKAHLAYYNKILGILSVQSNSTTIPLQVQNLLALRKSARANQDYATSDDLRDQINKLGFEVKDTNSGQIISKN